LNAQVSESRQYSMGAIRQGRYVLHVRIATASRRREHGAFLFVWSSDPIDFCPAV